MFKNQYQDLRGEFNKTIQFRMEIIKTCLITIQIISRPWVLAMFLIWQNNKRLVLMRMLHSGKQLNQFLWLRIKIKWVNLHVTDKTDHSLNSFASLILWNSLTIKMSLRVWFLDKKIQMKEFNLWIKHFQTED